MSGHRRHAAIGLILKRSPGASPNGVPCIVDREAISTALREFQLILGNADNRKLTPADEAQQLDRLSDCIRRLEDEGYEFPGRHRDWLSKLSGMSRTKIGRLQAIQHNLASSLLEHFNAGELGPTVAYRLSQEPAPIQHAVYRVYGKGINDLTEAQLEDAINRSKAPPKADAPAAPEPGKTYTADEYLAERAREDAEFFRMLAIRAMWFIDQMPRFTFSRQAGIEALKQRGRHSYASAYDKMHGYEGSPKGLSFFMYRKAPIFRTWTEVYDMLCTIALQLAPQIKAAAAPTWQTGTPAAEGLYWINMRAGSAYYRQIAARWDGSAWTVPANGTEIRSTVAGWYPLPEAKEE